MTKWRTLRAIPFCAGCLTDFVSGTTQPAALPHSLRAWQSCPHEYPINRTGIVTEVDRDGWLCRVKTGDLETNWINWLTYRAGKARTWWCPSPGEQVVLFSLGGNLETAFALPAIYSNACPPPSDSESADVTEYEDGGWFEYDPATGRWIIRGVKAVLIESSQLVSCKTGEFVIEADTTRINSNVILNGDVTHGGGAMTSNGIVADKHKHPGDSGGTTGGPI